MPRNLAAPLRFGRPVTVFCALGKPAAVSEVLVVEPDAEWAIDPVRGRDMLTLQTCTYPDAENHIVVRADRI